MGNMFSPDILGFVGMVWVQAEVLGLFDLGVQLGGILLSLLFTIRAWQAASSARGGEIRALFVRGIIAGALVVASPSVTNGLRNVWSSAFGLSMNAVRSVTTAPAEGMRDSLDDVMGNTATGGLVTVMAFMGGSDDSVNAAMREWGVLGGSAGAAGAAMTASRVPLRPLMRWFVRGLRLILAPIMAFFLVIVYVSAITVVLASIIFPIAAPFLLTSVGGSLMTGLVTRTLTAVATIFVIPLTFGTIMNLAIIYPLHQFILQIEDLSESAMDLVGGTGGATPITGNFLERGWAAITGETMTNILELINGAVELMIVAIVSLFVGLVAAVAVVRVIDSILARLVGAAMPVGATPGPRGPGLPPSGFSSSRNAGGGSVSSGSGGGSGPPRPAWQAGDATATAYQPTVARARGDR